MSVGSKSKHGYTHSVVSDHRWIHTNELRSGMYVTELDVPWEKTTFMFQGFFVNSQSEIDAVQRQASYARVKTEKVAKINPRSYLRLCGA